MRTNTVRKRLWLGVGVVAVAAVATTGASAVTSGGRLTTIAGGGSNTSDRTTIPAKSASLYDLSALAADGRGNVYFIEGGRDKVRKVSAGKITTIANSSSGMGQGLAADRHGNVYFIYGFVQKITPGGTITTVAGRESSAPTPCSSGDGGPATAATLCFARGLAVDDKGNLYITEHNNRIRKVSRDGTITTIAGTGKSGCSGDGGPATRARINPYNAIGVDAKGNVYFAETCGESASPRCYPGCVRKVSRDGTITTVSRKISGSIAVDRQGYVYITHDGDVFKVTPGGKTTTFVGPPSLVVDGRRGPVKPGELKAADVAVYGRGTLVIYSHQRIFKATAR